MFRTNNEPLLSEDDNRYVMFPIKDNDIWECIKQIDSFGEQKKLIYQKI